MLLSRQLLINVNDIASISSNAFMLPILIACNRDIPTIIYAIVGVTSFGSIPLTNGHNFSTLKINMSLCFHILKYEPSNIVM